MSGLQVGSPDPSNKPFLQRLPVAINKLQFAQEEICLSTSTSTLVPVAAAQLNAQTKTAINCKPSSATTAILGATPTGPIPAKLTSTDPIRKSPQSFPKKTKQERGA